MEKKKKVGIAILVVLVCIIVTLVIMFVVWRNALWAACMPTEELIRISEYPVVCTEFMPAPWYEQFWIFLKNLFNPITWDLIF